MTRFKDFGSGSGEALEPVTFKLFDEEFTCVSQVPGKFLLDLVTASGDTEDNNGAIRLVMEFFQRVLTDESFERFDTLLESKDKIVDVDTLVEISAWLIEEYTSRPESQPEAS